MLKVDRRSPSNAGAKERLHDLIMILAPTKGNAIFTPPMTVRASSEIFNDHYSD